ncbi:cupin domain-containing protein [Breoghania sp. JC706]|uniref:cupin domain-containing protein n=1 Tax=Breoghania sp. JC706 TaxID=3117732 RepID=UPI00300A04FA
MTPVTAARANFYCWGGDCSGWRLLELDHFQVRQEAMPAGAAEEPHMHRAAHQFFYVLSGSMTMRTPDGVVRVGAGQGFHVPPGLPHLVRNDEATELVFILSSSPSTVGDRHVVDTVGWAVA